MDPMWRPKGLCVNPELIRGPGANCHLPPLLYIDDPRGQEGALSLMSIFHSLSCSLLSQLSWWSRSPTPTTPNSPRSLSTWCYILLASSADGTRPQLALLVFSPNPMKFILTASPPLGLVVCQPDLAKSGTLLFIDSSRKCLLLAEPSPRFVMIAGDELPAAKSAGGGKPSPSAPSSTCEVASLVRPQRWRQHQPLCVCVERGREEIREKSNFLFLLVAPETCGRP